MRAAVFRETSDQDQERPVGSLAMSRCSDALDRMRQAETITTDMKIAGLRFAADYARGAQSDVSARVDCQAIARLRCDRAVTALGGRSSPAAVIVLAVLGSGDTIAEAAAAMRFAPEGRGMRAAVAAGVLVQALWALEAFYSEGDR